MTLLRREALADSHHEFKELSFTAEVAHSMLQVSRDAIPDLPDRIVAATALYLGVSVISRDGRIRTSNIETIW